MLPCTESRNIELKHGLKTGCLLIDTKHYLTRRHGDTEAYENTFNFILMHLLLSVTPCENTSYNQELNNDIDIAVGTTKWISNQACMGQVFTRRMSMSLLFSSRVSSNLPTMPSAVTKGLRLAAGS